MKDYQSLQGLRRQEGKTFEESKATHRYQQNPLQRVLKIKSQVKTWF